MKGKGNMCSENKKKEEKKNDTPKNNAENVF